MMSYFSRTKATHTQQIPNTQCTASNMKTFKILLVEDDLMFRTMLDDYLSQNPNYSVMAVSCGEECISNLAVNPDLIVMDYNMNSFNIDAANGLTTLKIVKRLKPDIPIIMLSGEEDTSTLAKAMFSGAYDYVMKGEEAFDKLANSIEELRRNAQIEDRFRDEYGG